MSIEVLTGPSAETLMKRPDFRTNWKKLHELCPWATVFQGEDFVLTWYEIYQSQFSPLIVLETAGNGDLAGLFLLAIDKSSGQITVAGKNFAEYQVWLALPQNGDSFIESSLNTLNGLYPNQTLTLQFALTGTPIEWARRGHWRKRCHVKYESRGIMSIGDGSTFRDALRKKLSNKINRLKRLGDFSYDKIETPEQLAAVFDEVSAFQTFRLKATQNILDIPHDPLKKTFFLSLMKFPGMVNYTLLRLNGQPISAHLHIYNNHQLMLWVLTHSSIFARFSPGLIHMMMLCAGLAENKTPEFDLTPGGEYKERYATHSDEAYVFKIFFSPSKYYQYTLERKLVEAAKPILQVFNSSTTRLKDTFSAIVDWKRKWRRLSILDMLLEPYRILAKRIRPGKELRVYAYDLKDAADLPASDLMKRDCISDLLLYQPATSSQPPVNAFLKQVLEKMEAGHQVYTQVVGGKLTQYRWLIESQNRKTAPGEHQGFELPPNSVLLTGFETNSLDPSLLASSLNQLLRAAAAMPGAKNAYICVPSGVIELRKMVEEKGFKYQYSLINGNAPGKAQEPATPDEAETRSVPKNQPNRKSSVN